MPSVITPDPALRRIVLAVGFVSFCVVGAALALETFFGFAPCDLCLYQRVPWFLVLGVAAVALARTVTDQTRRALLVVCTLILVAGGALAVYHVGIEARWWADVGACRSSSLSSIESIEDLAASLVAGVSGAPRCDESQVLIKGTGITLAQVNAGMSLGLSGLLIGVLVWRRRNRALPGGR